MHRVAGISEGASDIRKVLSDTLAGSAQLDWHLSTTSFLKDFEARLVPQVGPFFSVTPGRTDLAHCRSPCGALASVPVG